MKGDIIMSTNIIKNNIMKYANKFTNMDEMDKFPG